MEHQHIVYSALPGQPVDFLTKHATRFDARSALICLLWNARHTNGSAVAGWKPIILRAGSAQTLQIGFYGEAPDGRCYGAFTTTEEILAQ